MTPLLLTLAALVLAVLLFHYRVTLLAFVVARLLVALLALHRVLPRRFVAWAAIGLTRMLTREINIDNGGKL